MAEKKALDKINLEMPAYLEAEQAVLCCVMIDDYVAVTILSEVDETDFYSEANQKIVSAMKRLMNRNKPVDFVSVAGELETMGIMSEVGGISYLGNLNSFVMSSANYSHYLELVKSTSLRRKLIRASNNIIEKAYVPFDPKMPENNIDVLQLAEKEIFDIAQSKDRSSLVSVKNTLTETIAEIEEMSKNPEAFRGLPTQFPLLNRYINGLNKGDLIIIAARPGVGKSALAMNFVENATMIAGKTDPLTGKPRRYSAAVFSLEMPAVQIVRRMLCSIGGVPMDKVNSGKLTTKEWSKLFLAKSKLSDTKIFIDDSSLITPVEILSKCRRLKREQGLDLVMIDYLQLMGSGRQGRNDNRVQEIGEISRMLKVAAKELQVPILVLSQLSRDMEKRASAAGKGKDAAPKVAQLSDLRDSGAIEQDADIVIFIERDYSAATETGADVQCKLQIAKNRNGQTGYVNVVWQGRYVRYVDPNSESARDYAMPPVERKEAGAEEAAAVIEGLEENAREVESRKSELKEIKIEDEDIVGEVFGDE